MVRIGKRNPRYADEADMFLDFSGLELSLT